MSLSDCVPFASKCVSKYVSRGPLTHSLIQTATMTVVMIVMLMGAVGMMFELCVCVLSPLMFDDV
jgi:hypothetical protein